MADNRLIPVPRPDPAPTVLETVVALWAGLVVATLFFSLDGLRPEEWRHVVRFRLFDSLVLATGLGALFSSAAAKIRSDGGTALFLSGLDRSALREALLVFSAGLWALVSAARYPSLGAWGFIPAWGTLLLSFYALKVSWRRGSQWLMVSPFLRVSALLAPALTQRLLLWAWGEGGSPSWNTVMTVAMLVAWVAAFIWASEQVLLSMGSRPFIARLAPQPPEPELIRFETAAAPAEAARLSGGGEEALVETGTFRIDLERAVEKLGRFQLLDAAAFLVPWLRAAVASGATRVDAKAAGGLLEFRFDGLPLPPAVTSDPYSGLLGTESGEAPRQIALGLLALMRLSPAEVEIVSGIGAARRRARAPAEESPDDAPEPGADTVLRVRWTGAAAGRRPPAALEHLRWAYGMTDTALTIDGTPVPDPTREVRALKTWENRHARGAVLPQSGPFAGPRLRFYSLGALVEEVVLPDAWPGLYVATDGRFTLNLSQSAVVDDKARRASVASALNASKSVPKVAGKPLSETELGFRWAPSARVWAAWFALVAAAAYL